MLLLTEFLLRLAFGLAGAMALVSPRQVSSGYFRNHLYVTMGLSLLAALLARAAGAGAFWPAATAAVLSYLGSVCWLYEKPGAGRAALLLVAAAALVGALGAAPADAAPDGPAQVSAAAYTVTSGALLGLVMGAMLLGHWYLNAPGMALAPLRRLLIVAASVAVIHAALAAAGLALEMQAHSVSVRWGLFVTLRWLFGLLGVVILIWMAWRTLDIPNTQSATGILYVAVIGTFVGETMGLLLGAESAYPL